MPPESLLRIAAFSAELSGLVLRRLAVGGRGTID
jgi:hypothetical protein